MRFEGRVQNPALFSTPGLREAPATGGNPVEDPFNLERFVTAQAPVYERVRAELRAGRKTSHWIWFIFPQAKGLGRSPRSAYYAIGSHDEARAYLAHPLLGPRLKACVDLVLSHGDVPLEEILGDLDAMKFRSCVALFSKACGANWLRR